jgi:hypothetical protein
MITVKTHLLTQQATADAETDSETITAHGFYGHRTRNRSMLHFKSDDEALPDLGNKKARSVQPRALNVPIRN